MSQIKKPVIGDAHPDGRPWTQCTQGEVEIVVALPFLTWVTEMSNEGGADATGTVVTAFIFDELTPIGREALAASLATVAIAASLLSQSTANLVYQDRARAARFN